MTESVFAVFVLILGIVIVLKAVLVMALSRCRPKHAMSLLPAFC